MLDFSGHLVYSNQANSISISLFILCYVECFVFLQSSFCRERGIYILTFHAISLHRKSTVKLKFLFPSLLWCFGLCIGFSFAYFERGIFSSWMRVAVKQPVSIVALLVCNFLPLCLSALAYSIHLPLVGHIILFCKAVSFGFNVLLITFSFASSSWLVCLLLLFSDMFLCMILLWMCLIHASGNLQAHSWRYLAIGFGVIVMDYVYIAPFLQSIC